MKTLLFWIPSILWMSLIFYFSSQSTTQIGILGTPRFIFFKSLHLLEYSILFLTYFFATKSVKLSLLLVFLFASTDEYHQSFTPTRTPKLTDIVIDLTGAGLGSLSLRSNMLASKLKVR